MGRFLKRHGSAGKRSLPHQSARFFRFPIPSTPRGPRADQKLPSPTLNAALVLSRNNGGRRANQCPCSLRPYGVLFVSGVIDWQ